MYKVAHLYSGYHLRRTAVGLLRCSGMESAKSDILGAVSGLVVLSTVEVLDEFWAECGASTEDSVANAGGASVNLEQEFL